MRELGELIRVYDDALPAGACQQLLAEFHRLHAHQERNGAGVRPALEASAWYELDLSAHAEISTKALFLDQVQRDRSSFPSAAHQHGHYSLFVEATH